MSYKSKIINILSHITGVKDIEIEFPSSEDFGDYSTNVAMILAKKEGKNPRELAQEIADKIKDDLIEKVEVAGPGFINFWIKKDVLVDVLSQIDTYKEEFGKGELFKGKRMMFEFAHPNTHKAFHIGHLRNITTGESLSRLYDFSGAKVIRANYQGDVGLHIAKALYGIEVSGFEDPIDIQKRAEYLGKVYAKGSTLYEESDEAKLRVGVINEKIYNKSDSGINKLYEETRKWSLDYFESIYKRVYTKFDRYYFESEVADSGKEIVFESLKKGILKESDGAIIFPGSEYGLHDRVFITGKKVPTYEGKEMGLGKLQFDEYRPDLIVHCVGPEQSGYFQVLFKALELIFPETKGKELHVAYGWVRLKEGKMSSRTGNVVLGEEILDQAKAKILESYKVDEQTAEKIAVGAVKYSFLKNSLGQDIAFDLKESISLEGNSGPYIQYTYARIQSVLNKANKKDFDKESFNGLNENEVGIVRHLSRFPEIIEAAAKSYSPNTLCNYLYNLAQKYNSFYNKDKIIDSENEDFRLFLTSATGQIIKNGLNLLGIEAPEKM